MYNLNNDADKKLIKGLLHEMFNNMSIEDIRNLVGSIGVERLRTLYLNLFYENYCERHNIKVENMTDDDRLMAYLDSVEC